MSDNIEQEDQPVQKVDRRLENPMLYLHEMVGQLNTDYNKAMAGNYAAGIRARKILSEIRVFCLTLRKEVSASRKRLAKEE